MTKWTNKHMDDGIIKELSWGMNERIYEWMSEYMNEWVNTWMNQLIDWSIK